MPGLPASVNFASENLSGNLLTRGCDWFEIFNTGALTYGWHEDWANGSANYQTTGFQSDLMRAATRRKGYKFGIFDILCRHPWEIAAKGFLHIGHGNTTIHFFSPSLK